MFRARWDVLSAYLSRRHVFSTQGRRYGGAFRGLAPPNECLCPPIRKLCPPKRGLCPEEINRIGAAGVQIEAEIGVWTRIFVIFMDLHRILQNFGDEDLFFYFLEVTYFRAEKSFEFLISAEKSLWISVKTFFFSRSPIFGRKNRSNFWLRLKNPLFLFWRSTSSFDPDWDKFLVPSCPSQIHSNKLLVPPKIYFCPPPPPSHAILAPGLKVHVL